MVRGRPGVYGRGEGNRERGYSGVFFFFGGGPEIKLQALGHSSGEYVLKTFLLPNLDFKKFKLKGNLLCMVYKVKITP